MVNDMNNSFKFRVWDVKNKKFLPESNFAILGNGKLIVTLSGYYNHFTNTYQEDYIIQQYTGLHDVDGVRIFEGDIVEFTARYKQKSRTQIKVVKPRSSVRIN